jgi:hypothetical protein
METKTIAIIATAFVVILLFITIAYKIRSDKKRKSLSIHYAESGNNINVSGNAAKDKKPDLWGIPSWGLALLTMFLAFVVLMVVGDIIAAVFRIKESDAADLVFYILYNLIIAGGCFFIVRRDPKSIWYVPVLCNIAGIISSFIERNFWITPLWIVICGGWVLSIIASVTGAIIGRKIKIPEEQ